MEIISLRNITKIYKSKKRTVTALNNVSYSIDKGEAVGLIGMNGAGKSTAIKLMSGIIKPTSGDLSVMGARPFEKRKQLCRKYGVMFGQRSQLWWDLPAIDSFFVTGSIYRLNRKQVIRKTHIRQLIFVLFCLLNYRQDTLKIFFEYR